MTQFKRLIAFLLCLLMIFPTQELTILAETMSMDHVQAEEIISAEPIEDGTDLIEETQQSEPTEDGEDRIKETLPFESIEDEEDHIKETRPLESIEDEEDHIKETLPLEPMEDEADRIKETLPLEPMEDETDRVKETLPLEPIEDETDRIKETLPLEPIKGGNSGVDRINKTLLLEPLEDDTYAIYWNPGGQLPAELATPSDATATASDASATKARMGKDSASGLSPARPVKTLEKAVERAKKLMENKGLDSSDITIYAMNPMEVADGELYVLNAGNMRIASWPERPYQSDALFYVNGGQLALMNVLLEAEDPAYGPDETELIYVRGGSLQMGQNVNINGCVIMDYNSELEDIKWKEDIATPSNTVEIEDSAAGKSEQMKKVLPFQMLFSNDSETLNGSKTSTASKASTASKTSSGSKVSTNRKASTASQAGKASFHIDNYRLDTSEENVELLEDRISASTWKEPIIELMEGFDGSGGEYLLKVKDDGRAESRELVTTLYADEATAEEFLDYFTLVESDNWSLQVETAAAAQLRDTGSGEESTPNPFAFEEVTLTSKTLIASRSLGDAPVIYWNPGPARTLDGVDYPAGRDDGVDGTTPFASFKTWEAAAKAARKVNGTVVAMQTLDLGASGADEYLKQLPDGVFYMASENSSLITSLGTWNAAAQPAVVVPKDKTLIMKDLSLGGRYDGSGNVTEAQTILVKEGDLIIDKNVKTEEKGYIQLNAFRDLKNHPIQVCSVDSSDDGDLRVFFGGINNNIEYRYVDVVVPGGELEDSITNDEEADDVGKALLHRVKLHIANRSEEYGGTSDNDWSLRQDTNEDDNIVTAQNLELYAIYYFDAIYIDGVEGDNGNYGASCNYPVKTWARARAIWQSEMTKSLEARHKAVGSMTLGEIEAHYPMPEVIYICNTVTVDSASEPEWELEPRHDYARGTDVKAEVVSHIDHIAVQEEDNATAPRHEAPKTMIEVTGSGALSIKDIYIRNMVDDTDSVTIKVENGGTLTLKGDTTLNGTRLPSSGFTQKNLTLGCHIMVTKGHLEIDTTGSIEYKEQGVVAMGSETTVEMMNGHIQQNNSYRTDYYDAGKEPVAYKAGGGVALSSGARFTMNGGTINENQTYQYGAGVYLKDTGTSFIMKKGKISGNSMPAYRYSAMNSANLTVYGAGIYADKDTVVVIGDGTGAQEDTMISDNTAYLAKGSGVFSNGTLTIDNAKISDNIGGGISTSNIAYVYGVGIFVGADGTLTMNKGLVSGNHGSFTSVANVLGAGIYIEAAVNHSHKITKSTVTGNKAGYEASIGSNVLDYSQGGGIYLAAGNALEITDNTTISYNGAARGGGIYAVGGSGRNISLILEKTIIDHNDAIAYRVSSYGDSGGIYFKGYGILTLKDGTKITNNTAVQHSGGLYMGDFTTNSVPTANIYMKASQPGGIEISGNKVTESSTYGYGGGVSHFGGKWMAENVLIDNNEAVSKGGGVYVSSSAAAGIFRNMVFSNNRAVNGAALDIESGRYYLQDSEIEGNIAANRGGGIHLGTTAAYMYLSESTDGKFKIRNNRADYGGGIAITMGNTFVMNIAGPIQNHANVQGSNFCLDGYANIDILNGKFKQPDAAEQREGVYNIYINDTSISTSTTNPVYYNKYIDFSKVTFEKKTVGDPDVILLNSGNSFLTVLKEPPDSSGDFPIDLNKEAFQSGSIVLKPAGSITRVNMYPSDNLEEAWSSNFTYSNMDASSHLAYYQGGKLPRRSQLSGFKDEASPAKKNVIVLGEGVYLAGAASGGNDDSHYGTSPDDAVATFAKAKEILSDRIEAEAEKEGFAPFIYICGPVDIAANEPVWELDYNALLFKNKNYEITERSNGDPVYEPQVRRFASFLRQPMIKVGNNIDFTIGKLIIDGMADKVVVADQGDKSPVINGGGGSHVTLTGNSMIRNNYYSALDISGELTLKGDIGDENKQLYNNQSTHTVRLYGAAQMSMQGYSKIIAGDKVKKIGSFTSSGIWVETTSSGASVSMDDNSAIIQEPDSELLDGYLIYSSSPNSTIEMKGNARLEVGNSAIAALLSSNTGSKASMSGDTRIITLKDASLTYGAYVSGASSLTMSDRAEIIYGGVLKSSVYGIYLISTTAPLSLKMQDKAAVTLTDNATGAYNYYGIYVHSGESPRVELLNNVTITGNLDSKISGMTYGIYAGTASAKNVSILLNMDDGGFEDKSVLIKDMGIGIYLGPAENCFIGMGKSALIDGGSGEGTIGICVENHSSAASAANVLMKGCSKIRNTIYAVQFYRAMGGPINIKMEDFAAIEQNEEGIYEYATTGSIWRLNVELSNDARISGNAGSGIDLGGAFSWSRESGGFQDIILNDNAIIGGNVDYSSTDPTSGNKSSGIYATGPVKVTMNGASKISGNGFYDYNGTSANAPSSGEALSNSGIYLVRAVSSTHRAGTAEIIMNDDASICDNHGGGIYAATLSSTNYHNNVIIELNGSSDGEMPSAPSIKGNTDALYLGADTTLKLKGEASVEIGNNPYETSSYKARAIDNYGYIELDGRSTVKGLIYMNNGTKPITMTHSAAGSTPKYDLHLVEGFTGNTVVKPDMIGIMDLTSDGVDGSQLVYFNKFSADGMAASRPIAERKPNLVLMGENNVYLSGNGNDSNSGDTPSTAVKTFKHARELLEGEGNYTEKANIIICGTVNVLLGDKDWSFGPGGYVKNTQSGDQWQPLVIRYERFSGTLIRLPYGNTYESTVTFKNITIDGGSENGNTILTSSQSRGNIELLAIERGKTAILDEGAVLQNNKAVTNSESRLSNYTVLGVDVYGGILEINGGTIRNMGWEEPSTYGLGGFHLASAVLVQGVDANLQGKLIMKSGQIINNDLNILGAGGTSNSIGTINVNGSYSNMEMRGGMIENNRVASNDLYPAVAGTIVNYNGNVTISGGIIRGNEGRYGSAIFYYGTSSSSKLIFSGGQISGNTTNVSGQQPVDKYSPIYVERNGFELYGGGADIRDSIYLKQTQSAIKVSDSIYQAGRSYRVCLNFDYFKKGSVVVEPDGNKVTNVTSYLKYFDVRSNPFVLDQGRTSNPAGNVAGVKEEQCLILMKAVYLDSEHGKDTNNGLKPSQAVKSFNKAKSVGATGNGTFDHYVIYIYDKASNIDGEALWTLPKTAYMCRYTGFPVYESDGTETQELEREYHGCLIEPGSELVFSDITIQGRRNTDSTEHNGDSLVNILSGVNVTVESGAVFSGNYNNGNYIAEDGRVYNLPSKGGAFQVAEGGSLRISGGEMKGNSAVDGSAIYLHASESNQSSLGQLYLTGSPTISGKVYLDGTADITSAYIQPDALYLPSEPLQISVSNDYNGRPLIKYSNVPTPGETELNHYSFDDAIKALYDIVNNNSEPNILELSLRKVIYLDGQRGSDSNDGTTPETAFGTLKRTFEEIKKQGITMGVLVYIVGTVDVDGEESDIQLMNLKVPDGNGTYHYEGYYMDLNAEKVDIRAQVYFKRYSMPKNYNAEDPVYEGYNRATLRDSLFNIDQGGKLTLSGIYLDGHSISSDSSYPTLTAPAVKAKSPLITVKNDGTLKCNRAEDESNSVSTVTMFVNNVNEKKHKDKVVGHLDSSPVYEGSSAGIELLDGGTCILESTEFSNLALDNGVIGGTDVYSNGFLHFSYETIFGGSVFLEGFGTKGENTETSRYLTADVYGTPVKNSFQVLMRDPYMGRDVVHYPQSFTASATDAGYFLLEERVKDYFYLSNRAGYPHILELSVPVAVYIDGTPKGNDDLFDPKAGSTPKNPVRTLRRAFELLKTRGGNTIYVVNAIQVESDIQVTGMSYVGNDGNVILGSTSKVNIVRYIQPDFARESSDDAESEEYDVADYTGVLLNVKDGASAWFSANVNFDGHSEKKESPDLPKGAVVSRNSEAKTPLITVEKGGTLNLLSDVALFDNKNTYADGDSSGQHGGAISNSGTTIVDGALFKNNVAAKGSVAYQDGTFTIKSAPENLADNPKAFYLTTENTGTPEQPVWGEDHVIQTAVAIPDGQSFDIDMYPERAVAGRDVVHFTNNLAYNPNADAEQDHFHLGSTVPEELFLVEAENDPDVLELQDWEVLKVEVPADIYLVVCRKGSYDSTNKLMGVISDPSAGTDLFTAPEYTFKNKGSYDAKVFISGFENKTLEAGITADPMNLTASAAAATTANDLYLAVKGLDDVTGGSGFGIAETSLQPYAESPVTAAPVALGTLKKDMSGKFTFIGAVGSGFVEKYIDPDLVVEGSTKTQVQEYMDGSNGGPIKAKAKYLLKYKVEIDPSRRTP